MKYYSEITKSVYDTEKDLKAAEEKVAAKKAKEEELKNERAKRAEEVTKAFDEVNKAQKKANDLLDKFVKDYGSYHLSLHSSDPFSFSTPLLDWLMKW